MNDQVLIGVGCALLCGLGFRQSRTLLAKSTNGRRLADLLGEDRALGLLRMLLAAGVVFGALLAADLIRPIDW